MKQKIINWINRILGTEKRLLELIRETWHLQQRIITLQQQVDLFKQVINVGVDVHQSKFEPSRSWAVICIQGKADYIAFVDLDPNEIRTIQRFLRNFERSNVTIDHPRFPKDIFFKL